MYNELHICKMYHLISLDMSTDLRNVITVKITNMSVNPQGCLLPFRVCASLCPLLRATTDEMSATGVLFKEKQKACTLF